MAMQQNKKRNSILNNPWQIIGFLAAAGCALFSIHVQASLTFSDFFSRALLENYIVVSIIIAIANLVLTKKYMFVAAIPIVYSMVIRIFNLFTLYGYWKDVILEAILFVVVTIVVLCATAYSFASKKTPFVLLLLLFGTKIGIMLYGPASSFIQSEYDFAALGALYNWELVAIFLFFTSIATTTYIIASGKNHGFPHKAVASSARENKNDYIAEQIDMSDILPYIKSETIETIADNITIQDCSGLVDYNAMRRGLFVMDSLTQDGDEIPEGGFRSYVIGLWIGNRYRDIMKKHISYKILNALLWVGAFALCVVIAVQNGMVSLRFLDITSLINLGIVIAIAIIPFFIVRAVCISVLQNFFKKPGNPVEVECSNLPESFFCSCASESAIFDFDSYLENICASLNLDSAKFKVDLGKQTGGYTDFYHVGTGGIRISGTDAVFGLLSHAIAGSRNSAVNSRLKSLETLLFYNKVVIHFYEKVLPKIDSSLLLAFIPRVSDDTLQDAASQAVSAVINSDYCEQPVVPQQGIESINSEQPLMSHQKKNTIALVGFTLSLVGLVGFVFFGIPAIPGLICSIIGAVQSKNYQSNTRKGIAIAGIIIGGVAIMIYGVIIIAVISELSGK